MPAKKATTKPPPPESQEEEKKETPPEKLEEELPDKQKEEEQPSPPVTIKNIDRKQFAKNKTVILDELPAKLQLPKYFVNPDDDSVIRRLEYQEALSFLTGPLNIGSETAPEYISISAKVAYIGPRRFVSRQVRIGTMGTNPQHNYWKLWDSGARFFHSQEHAARIKDPDFIRECLESENWKIRFVVDESFTRGKAEARLLKRNVAQWLGHPYRLREGAILLGQEVPLHRGEAATILNKIRAKEVTLDKKFAYILKYLEKQKSEDQKQEKAETQ